MIEIATNKILKTLREMHNYSQEYVASYLKINQNSYSKLESGQTRLTIDRVTKLAELYNVEPEIFLSSKAVIHYNKGAGSKSNSGYIHSFINTTDIDHNNLYEKILCEKEQQIRNLQEQLKDLKEKEKHYLALLEKLAVNSAS